MPSVTSTKMLGGEPIIYPPQTRRSRDVLPLKPTYTSNLLAINRFQSRCSHTRCGGRRQHAPRGHRRASSTPLRRRSAVINPAIRFELEPTLDVRCSANQLLVTLHL